MSHAVVAVKRCSAQQRRLHSARGGRTGWTARDSVRYARFTSLVFAVCFTLRGQQLAVSARCRPRERRACLHARADGGKHMSQRSPQHVVAVVIAAVYCCCPARAGEDQAHHNQAAQGPALHGGSPARQAARQCKLACCVCHTAPLLLPTAAAAAAAGRRVIRL